MAAVFSRRSMRVRCATQRDHVFHPEMNYSQTQLDQLDRLTERRVADHLQKGKTSKESKELVTLEYICCIDLIVFFGLQRPQHTPQHTRRNGLPRSANCLLIAIASAPRQRARSRPRSSRPAPRR